MSAQQAAVHLVYVALLDVRGSAYRRELCTMAVPATESGDYVDHMQAVAAATIDLPSLIAYPRGSFNRHTLAQWLSALADGDTHRAAWVRAALDDIGYVPEPYMPPTPRRKRQS